MNDLLRVQAPPQAAAPARPLRVVLVDEELPYPPRSGKRIRTLGLIERLAARPPLAEDDTCVAV